MSNIIKKGRDSMIRKSVERTHGRRTIPAITHREQFDLIFRIFISINVPFNEYMRNTRDIEEYKVKRIITSVGIWMGQRKFYFC